MPQAELLLLNAFLSLFQTGFRVFHKCFCAAVAAQAYFCTVVDKCRAWLHGANGHPAYWTFCVTKDFCFHGVGTALWGSSDQFVNSRDLRFEPWKNRFGLLRVSGVAVLIQQAGKRTDPLEARVQFRFYLGIQRRNNLWKLHEQVTDVKSQFVYLVHWTKVGHVFQFLQAFVDFQHCGFGVCRHWTRGDLYPERSEHVFTVDLHLDVENMIAGLRQTNVEFQLRAAAFFRGLGLFSQWMNVGHVLAVLTESNHVGECAHERLQLCKRLAARAANEDGGTCCFP